MASGQEETAPALDGVARDRLGYLFAAQLKLNNYVFQKQHISVAPGTVLTVEQIQAEANAASVGPNSLATQWMKNYLWALQEEGKELEAELPKKWWSKDPINMQNVRVEIVDQLHFWISLAQAAGMNDNDVFRLYMQKNLVNLNRQDQGYSKATKDEADNKNIK